MCLRLGLTVRSEVEACPCRGRGGLKKTFRPLADFELVRGGCTGVAPGPTLCCPRAERLRAGCAPDSLEAALSPRDIAPRSSIPPALIPLPISRAAALAGQLWQRHLPTRVPQAQRSSIALPARRRVARPAAARCRRTSASATMRAPAGTHAGPGQAKWCTHRVACLGPTKSCARSARAPSAA